MLSHQRRAPRYAPRRAIEKIRRARVAELAAELGMLDLDEVATLGQLLVVEQRLGGANGGVGLAQKLRALEQLVTRIVLDPIVENFEQMLGHEIAIHHLLILGRVEIGSLAVGLDPFDERGPVAERAMHDVAVAAFAHAKETAPMQSAAARLGLAALEKCTGNVLYRGRGGLLHAEVDPLAFSGAIAREQREHHGDRAVVRRRMIRLQTERTNRSVIGKAVDVEHPAQCGQHRIVRDEVAPGAGLAERRNRAEDEGGVLAMESIPAEAEPVEGAGRVALDDDVGGAGELEENISAARMVEIKREGAFVEVVEPEEQAAVEMRKVVEERADAARVVAGGRFDFDDVGTHVGQQSRAKLCAMAGQVKDPQARERAGLGHGFFADFPASFGASICSSSCLTLGGGKSSIANAPVSSVAGTSIRTS